MRPTQRVCGGILPPLHARNVGRSCTLGPCPTCLGAVGRVHGRGAIELPIPVDPSLCASVWCTQWFVVCRSAVTIGVGISNATQFVIAR